MIHHAAISDADLHALIKSRRVQFAGNARLKIYGRLRCASGRRMLRANRIFFATEAEALAVGYRPCGSCMRADYLRWKASAASR